SCKLDTLAKARRVQLRERHDAWHELPSFLTMASAAKSPWLTFLPKRLRHAPRSPKVSWPWHRGSCGPFAASGIPRGILLKSPESPEFPRQNALPSGYLFVILCHSRTLM